MTYSFQPIHQRDHQSRDEGDSRWCGERGDEVLDPDKDSQPQRSLLLLLRRLLSSAHSQCTLSTDRILPSRDRRHRTHSSESVFSPLRPDCRDLVVVSDY
jgi:hypothetical protein